MGVERHLDAERRPAGRERLRAGRPALDLHGCAGQGRAAARTGQDRREGFAGEFLLDGRPVTINSPRDAASFGIEVVYQDLALCDNLDVVRQIVADVESELGQVPDLGRIDVVVNNAGGTGQAAFASVLDDAWQNDINIKVFGQIRTARAAIAPLTLKSSIQSDPFPLLSRIES